LENPGRETTGDTESMQEKLLIQYKTLLERIDRWFSAAIDRFPHQIRCADGCSGCCRSLFDITLLDATMLRQGFALLPPEVKQQVQAKAERRLTQLQTIWPNLSSPFMLNDHPQDRWEELMPDEDETPCVLLDSEGRCMVYAYRPMTCRLHGLPLVDMSGEVMHDEWCTENFTDMDPLGQPELSAPFSDIFRREVSLGREFSRNLLGEVVFELDTVIPLALLVDYSSFDWPAWWKENRVNFLRYSSDV